MGFPPTDRAAKNGLAWDVAGDLLVLTPLTSIVKGPLAGCSLMFVTVNTFPLTEKVNG